MLQDILASAGTGEQEALERRAVWEPWLTVLMDRIQTMVLSEPGWFGWRMMEYWSKWIQCGLDVTGSSFFYGFTVLHVFTISTYSLSLHVQDVTQWFPRDDSGMV